MDKLLYTLLFSSLLLGVASCEDKNEIKLPDISVGFSATEIGYDGSNASEDISITLSRASVVAITAEITIATTDVEYGNHFTTTPAASANKLSVEIPAGQTSASFSVAAVEDILFEGEESITFTISSLSVIERVKIGDKRESILKFGAIISAGETMILNGKTEEEVYFNSVYVDFSSNRQVLVPRKSWHLGFWCGSEFLVSINGANSMAATPSAKTDIAAVTEADANVLLSTEFDLNANPMSALPPSESAFDSSDGKLAGLAFGPISATDADNAVYFVASGDDKVSGSTAEWYKVKITRKGSGYNIKYAKVGSTDIKSVDIPKKEGYNFTFFSLVSGVVVDVEAEATKWDIKWSYDAGYSTSMAAPMYMFMQDFVSINNLGGASVARVEISGGVTFDSFGASGIAALTFSSDRDFIGDRWRSVGGMGGAVAGVKTDHFYVLKDPAGNHYKFRFTRFGVNSDGTERGRPEVEYKLIN